MGWQMRDAFFHWAGLTKETVFFNGLNQKQKKKRKTNNIAAQSGLTKYRQSFQTGRKKVIMYWTKATINVNVPMKYVPQFS